MLVEDLLSRYLDVRPTRYIFVLNYRTLQDYLLESERGWFFIPARDPFTLYSPEVMTRLLESSRLLHNFLAAAMTLKDHANRVADRVFTEEFFQAYDRQVKDAFSQDPLCRFLQELRNYSLHRQLPMAGAKTTWAQNQPPTTMITLSKKQLLEWDNWSGPSKIFLGSMDEQVPVRSCVEQYFKLSEDFHRWFEQYFYTTYAKPLGELHQLRVDNIKQHVGGELQQTLINDLARQHSDILVDDNWTLDSKPRS